MRRANSTLNELLALSSVSVEMGGVEVYGRRAETRGIVGASGKANPIAKAKRKRQRKARRRQR